MKRTDLSHQFLVESPHGGSIGGEVLLRKFNIWDAMVFVAWTALLLRVGLLIAGGSTELRLRSAKIWGQDLRPEAVLHTVLLGSATLVAPYLRKPIPSWTDLVKPPGFVACSTAIVALFTIAIPAADWSRPFVVGAAVGAAWLFLGVTRRWHPEPSWITAQGAHWDLDGSRSLSRVI